MPRGLIWRKPRGGWKPAYRGEQSKYYLPPLINVLAWAWVVVRSELGEPEILRPCGCRR